MYAKSQAVLGHNGHPSTYEVSYDFINLQLNL